MRRGFAGGFAGLYPTFLAAVVVAAATALAAYVAVTVPQIRVKDGDSFVVGLTEYRLAGVDTPELNGACKTDVARAAQARLLDLARAAGRDWSVRTAPAEFQRDRHKRPVVYLSLAGRDAGDTLVAEGLARRWTPGDTIDWCAP